MLTTQAAQKYRVRPRARIRTLPGTRPRAYRGEKAVSDWLTSQGLSVLHEQREYTLARGVWVPDIYVPELNLNIEVTQADLYAADPSPKVRHQSRNKLLHKHLAARYVDTHYVTTSVVVTWADLQLLEVAPERFLPGVQRLIGELSQVA